MEVLSLLLLAMLVIGVCLGIVLGAARADRLERLERLERRH